MSNHEAQGPSVVKEGLFVKESPINGPLVQKYATEVKRPAQVCPGVFSQERGGNDHLGCCQFHHGKHGRRWASSFEGND